MAAKFIDRLRGYFPARQPAQPFNEQGVGGYVIMRGVVVQRESNAQLIGQNRYRTAADMLTSVSIVAASLRYTLNLMARPKWKADPADDSAAAIAAAEFVDEILADAGTNWTRIVRRSAMYRFHGFGIAEWVAKKRDDGRIGIASVEARPQHTIERWDIDKNGGVIGVWQRDPMTSQEIYLPRRKLIYMVDDTLTDRPDGMGWFRHLVDPMNRLKAFLKLEGIGFQRDLTGIPIGRAPLQKINELVKSGKLKQDQADRMIDGIADFCRLETKNENTGLVLDSTTFRGKTQDGEQISQVAEWGMELLTGEQSSMAELGEAIRRVEFEMALIMGTSSMLTGREGEGSRALSEDQSRNLYLTVNSTLDDMAQMFQSDLIDPIWAMNGLDDALKPRLTHEDAGFKDAQKIAQALRDMATAGAILAPDDPAINDLRSLMGVSEAPPMDAEMLALLRGDPPADPNADPNAPPDDKGDGKDGKQPKGKPAPAKKAAPRSMYVQRKLLNADTLIEWAKGQGFDTTTPADDMHVTQAFSRAEVDWLKMGVAASELTVPEGGPRVLEPLGDKGAVVLLFRSPELETRHADMLANGASHDFDSYQPHVTITYQGPAGLDLSAIQPFGGELHFGPEIFAEVDDSWKDKLTEKIGV